MNKELTMILQRTLKPLEEKIESISKNLSDKVIDLEKRIDFLEKQEEIKDQKIAQLSNVISNMQRSLNLIDGKERSLNVIVKVLSEDTITVNETALSTDEEKISFVCQKIGFDKKDLENVELLRIGQDSRGEKRRIIKMVFKDHTSREKLVKLAPNLKNLQEPLKNIYISRDSHPVSVAYPGIIWAHR